LAEEIRDTVWIIGLISEDDPTILRMEVCKNRTISTITSFLDRNVLPGSHIKSDGYPSYPKAIENANCVHSVINHTLGFVNEDGDHTNSIENVWSHLKTDLRTSRGVRMDRMNIFIQEFMMYRFCLCQKTRQNVHNLFSEMIKFE